MRRNDPQDIRKTVTHNFIYRLTGNDMASVIDFDGSPTVLEPFTFDKEKLHEAVEKIDSYGVTDIGAAVEKGIEQFEFLDHKRKSLPKFIVLLTDGEGDCKDEHIALAKQNNIKIYTIGLGDTISEDLLKKIATETGGEYFHASEASMLNKIFEKIADKTDLYKDSDGDGIKDYYEKEMDKGHLRLGTGIALTGTDYLNKDSDGDGLLDGEEVKVEIGKRKMRNTTGFRDVPQYNVTLKATSNNTKIDSDGDGLLDNDTENFKGRVVLPKDPDPMKINGPLGIWKREYEEVSDNNYGTELKEKYETEIPSPTLNLFLYRLQTKQILLNKNKNFWERAWDFTNSKTAEEVGSNILMFKRDNNKNKEYSAIHSQVNTWQRDFGYNDFYDLALEIATSGNTRRKKFKFSPQNNSKHIVWMWRGDYLNLGSGAEIGIYNNPIYIQPIPKFFKNKFIEKEIENWKVEQKRRLKQLFPDSAVMSEFELVFWDVVPFELPMTLSLYDYKSKDSIETLFLWRPTQPQWWITGFKGNKVHLDVERLAMVGSIDFSGRHDLYDALKEYTLRDDKHRKFMIFHEDKIKNERKVWIVWWGADRSS